MRRTSASVLPPMSGFTDIAARAPAARLQQGQAHDQQPDKMRALEAAGIEVAMRVPQLSRQRAQPRLSARQGGKGRPSAVVPHTQALS